LFYLFYYIPTVTECGRGIVKCHVIEPDLDTSAHDVSESWQNDVVSLPHERLVAEPLPFLYANSFSFLLFLFFFFFFSSFSFLFPFIILSFSPELFFVFLSFLFFIFLILNFFHFQLLLIINFFHSLHLINSSSSSFFLFPFFSFFCI